MKKAMVILLIFCVLISTAGCSFLNDANSLVASKETVFSIDNYNLQITADSTFYENTGGSFDLQITNDYAYISIMVYQYTDLPEGLTPLEGYDIQNQELFDKRTAVTVITDSQTQKHPQGMVTYGLYSAKKEGTENYYATYLVDFPDEEIFTWVLVTATPEYYTDRQAYLHDFVCSLTVH